MKYSQGTLVSGCCCDSGWIPCAVITCWLTGLRCLETHISQTLPVICTPTGSSPWNALTSPSSSLPLRAEFCRQHPHLWRITRNVFGQSRILRQAWRFWWEIEMCNTGAWVVVTIPRKLHFYKVPRCSYISYCLGLLLPPKSGIGDIFHIPVLFASLAHHIIIHLFTHLSTFFKERDVLCPCWLPTKHST